MAVVPAIPEAALMAISDPNARQVLRAVSDGIAVRNGDAGNGDNAFLTMGNIKGRSGLAGQLAVAIAPAMADGISSNASHMQVLADALQQSVLDSPAWQAMFSQLQLIAAPESVEGSFANGLAQAAAATGYAIQDSTTATTTANDITVLDNQGIYVNVGTSISAFTLEQSYRADKDNALASAINTIWASVGGNTALIQDGQLAAVNGTGATATQWNQLQAAVTDPVTNKLISSATINQNMTIANTAISGLNAQWGVKIDLSTPGKAYVAGVALNSAVDANGITSSSFNILADSFAVGAPGKPDIVPFAIDATTGLVAIRGDLVVKNSITASSMAVGTITAQSGIIGNLAVGTLQIANQSVTVPASISGYGAGTFTGSGSYWFSEIGAATLSPTYPAAAKVNILVTWQVSAPGGGGNTRVQIRMDGSTVLDQSDTAYAGLSSSHVASTVVSASAGTHSFTLWFTNDWPGGGTWSLNNWSVTILGVMK